MPSIRLQIRDRVIVELNTARPGGIPEVTKRRWTPDEADDDPTMAVVFVEEPATRANRSFPITKRDLLIGVECVVCANGPELVDDLVEPMLEWAVAVLGDTNLNTLAHDVTEQSTVWETARLEKNYLRATVRFSIAYQTVRNDLTKKQSASV